jgi:hypothetical protein
VALIVFISILSDLVMSFEFGFGGSSASCMLVSEYGESVEASPWREIGRKE